MVDRQLRDELALRIEGFLLGRIDGPTLGRGFRRLATASKAAGHPDPAIPAVFARLWQEYPEYVVVGSGPSRVADRSPLGLGPGSLSAASWNAFVRAVVFLRSDRELEWPEEQWDPYDALGSPPDYLALLLVAGAALAGLTALGLLLCRQWTPGLVLALVAAALAGLHSRLGSPRSRVPASLAGDPSAFPFLSQNELVDELRYQSGPCVPFRPEPVDGR